MTRAESGAVAEPPARGRGLKPAALLLPRVRRLYEHRNALLIENRELRAELEHCQNERAVLCTRQPEIRPEAAPEDDHTRDALDGSTRLASLSSSSTSTRLAISGRRSSG